MKLGLGPAYVIVVLLLLSVASFAKTGEDPPIPPMPGAVLQKDLSEYKPFHSCEFSIDGAEQEGKTTERVRGEYWKLRYDTPGLSEKDVFDYYRRFVKDNGGRIRAEGGSAYVVNFTLSVGSDHIVWGSVDVVPGSCTIWLVLEKYFQRKLVHLARIPPILFDANDANLKIEHLDSLTQAVKLMQDYPDLHTVIQGHADSQEEEDLSQRRAEVVKIYLHLFGVSNSRMTVEGKGCAKPLDASDTPEKRALNRRVLLEKG